MIPIVMTVKLSPEVAPRKQPRRAGRAHTVIAIPKDGNRVYGSDVPMPWKEAASHMGIPERSFLALVQRREITVQPVGRRTMVRPSAIRDYLERQEIKAI